jgi:hypothetical protein
MAMGTAGISAGAVRGIVHDCDESSSATLERKGVPCVHQSFSLLLSCRSPKGPVRQPPAGRSLRNRVVSALGNARNDFERPRRFGIGGLSGLGRSSREPSGREVSYSEANTAAATMPFWRRGLVVLVVTVVVGPMLGALILPSIEAIATLASGRVPSSAKFADELRSAFGLALIVGVPFAAAVAALVLAWIVARRGTVGYGTCAFVAFLVPCVLSLPVLGGLFVLAPFIGLAAPLIALVVRAIVGRIAARFVGRPDQRHG